MGSCHSERSPRSEESQPNICPNSHGAGPFSICQFPFSGYSISRRQLPHFSLSIRRTRPNREVLVAAGFTPVRRYSQLAPNKSQCGVYVFGRDALHFLIAAYRTVRPHRISQRHHPAMKSRVAIMATPRIHTKRAQNIVRGVMATRTSCVRAFADGAGHPSTSKQLPIIVPQHIPTAPPAQVHQSTVITVQ
jgi:hypothetical protein